MSAHVPGDATRSHAPAAGATAHIDPSWSVNDVLMKYPATISVFNAFGVDACCGGAQSLREAAAGDGIDLDALVAALEQVVS